MIIKKIFDLFFTSVKLVLLPLTIVLFVNCRAIQAQKEGLIGTSSIERKFDEKGALIYYKKVNVKHTGYRHRPHMTTITRTTSKVIEDNNVVVYYFAKSRMSMVDWPDARVLKSKRIVWDENRKKTITRIPSK